MRRVGELVRNLLGLDDGNPALLTGGANPAFAVRWRVAVGAAMLLGGVAIVLSIVLASIASLTTPTGVLGPGLGPEISANRATSPAPAASGEGGSRDGETSTGTTGMILVHVVGAVVVPGLYSVRADGRIIDAVMAAGGLSAVANPCAINLAQAIADGEQIIVPATIDGSDGDESRCAGVNSAVSPGQPGGTSASAQGLVSLATATVAELDTLPGIGPALAQRIIDWREATGGFSSIEQLGEVSGIGDKVLANILDKVTL
jgi:competence protein ComEA